MQLDEFVRKPFVVKAVQITAGNIAEIADLVGGLKVKEDGETPYIEINRRKLPNVYRVYVGYWMTKIGKSYRCYSDPIFRGMFAPTTEELEDWIEFLNEEEFGA